MRANGRYRVSSELYCTNHLVWYQWYHLSHSYNSFINYTRSRRHFLVSVRNPERLYDLESDPFLSLTSPAQCQVQFLKICKLIILESSYYEFQTSNDSSPKKYKFFDRKLFIYVFMFRKMNHK